MGERHKGIHKYVAKLIKAERHIFLMQTCWRTHVSCLKNNRKGKIGESLRIKPFKAPETGNERNLMVYYIKKNMRIYRW